MIRATSMQLVDDLRLAPRAVVDRLERAIAPPFRPIAPRRRISAHPRMALSGVRSSARRSPGIDPSVDCLLGARRAAFSRSAARDG